MSKLLLLSVVFAMIFIAARAARDKDRVRGLRRFIRGTLLFNLFYLFVLLFIYGRI